MHGPVHKSDLNYSYSISHFSRLPQAFAKNIIHSLSRKVSYAYNIIDLVINLFIPNEVRIHLHICDHLIVNFGIGGLCLGFSNTSHVDSLDRFIKSFVDNIKTDVCIFIKENHSEENDMKIQYTNKFVQKLGMSDPTTCVYQFIYD